MSRRTVVPRRTLGSRPRGPGPGAHLPAHPLLRLQRTVGNRATAQLVRGVIGGPLLQRQPRIGESTKPKVDHPEAPWQKDLDAILPGGVGLLTDIDRVVTLLDLMGSDELARVAKLIRGSKDATAIVKHHGVPGIIAIFDTLTGPRADVPPPNLDLPAARFLLANFPPRTRPAVKRDPKSPPEAFPVEAVREAFVQYHRNALLDKEDEHKRAIRQNCIEIVRSLVPKLFAADPSLAKRIRKELKGLKGGTLTMPHAGAALSRVGVTDKTINIKFKDGNGSKTAPEFLESSAWTAIINEVGTARGWHVFGVSVFSGFHSAAVFVDNTTGKPRLYWADQWNLSGGEQFGQVAGAISGFREYADPKKLDGFIEHQTNRWWTKDVYHKDSECAKRAVKRGKKWENFCKYPATLTIWHFQTVAK